MEKSRIKNSYNNIKTAFITQILNKVIIFLVRTIFIKTLNEEYLGINGLFTNILSILSLAELGVGTAIIYSIYKPVARDDKEKIKSLMKLYKNTYTIIGIIIFVIGLIIIPFIPFIAKDTNRISESIVLIYILYLINTSISYFFAYKKSIISAYQQESIINKYDIIVYGIKSIIEIIMLIIYKNFIMYLVIEILFTLLENMLLAIKANKMFPYLKEKEVKKLEKKEKKEIFTNVKSLMIYKVGSVVLSGTDNILLSIITNISTVGICSNYIMIINAVKSVIGAAQNGITASVGNLNAEDNEEKKKEILYQLTLMNFIIYSFIAIVFIIFLNIFIKIWVGESYVLDISIPIILALNFYIEGIRAPAYTYRVTLGLFNKGKSTPYIAIVINIISSIILGKIYGPLGIFIGTFLSQLFSYCWIDPYLIFKYEFKSNAMEYMIKKVKYFILFVFTAFITYFIINKLELIDINIIKLFVALIIVIIIPLCIYYLALKNTVEFKGLKEKLFKVIKKNKI